MSIRVNKFGSCLLLFLVSAIGGIFFIQHVEAQSSAYKLPYPAGSSYLLTQENDTCDEEGGTHCGKGKYAFDFAMPRGASVVASREGTVLIVKDDSDEGGCDGIYGNKANYIVIDHGDSTSALYLHLMYTSAIVEEGEWVYQGQEIASSNATGHACGNHLHFQVQQTPSSRWNWYTQSIPISFSDDDVISKHPDGIPLGGETYLSDNVLVSTPVPENTPTATIAPSPTAISTPYLDSENIDFIGQIGGVTKSVDIQGDYAYLGQGPRLVILDISNPASITEIGRSSVFPSVVQTVSVESNYAYIANYEYGATEKTGLWIMDVSDPSKITEVGHLETHWTTDVVDVEILEEKAYIATITTLNVIDLADLARPVQIGELFIGQGWNKNITGISVAGDYVYIAAGNAGLRVIDVSEPVQPIEVGAYEMAGEWEYANDVAVSDGYVYVAGGFSGLYIMDISLPSNPEKIASYEVNGAARNVAIAGRYAYVSVLFGGQTMDAYLTAVDISVPTHPQGFGTSDPFSYAPSLHGLVIDDNIACIIADETGLILYDISIPSDRMIIGNYKVFGETTDIDLVDEYIYITERFAGILPFDKGALRIMDVSNPAAPMEKSHYEVSRGVNSVSVVGEYAYTATATGLEVVDVSDPTNPEFVSSFYAGREAVDILVIGNYAYIPVDNTENPPAEMGLYILDISTPSDPKEISFVEIPGVGSYGWGDLAALENSIYVVDTSLWVIDQNNLSDPSVIGQIQDWPATAITVADDYVYLGNDFGGITIMNLSNPLEITQVADISFGPVMGGIRVMDIYVVGNLAYIANGNTMRVVDISAPSNPIEIGHFETPGWSEEVDVGDNIYVAAGDAGLLLLRFAAGIEFSQSNETNDEQTVVKTVVVARATPVDKLTQTTSHLACPGSLPTRLWVGGYAYVNPEPPLPNLVRLEPGRDHAAAGQIQPGGVMEIHDGPICNDGYTWWQVTDLSTGITGWTAEGDSQSYWLVPCDSVSACGE